MTTKVSKLERLVKAIKSGRVDLYPNFYVECARLIRKGLNQ